MLNSLYTLLNKLGLVLYLERGARHASETALSMVIVTTATSIDRIKINYTYMN